MIGEAGLLVDPYDIDQIANAIRRIFRDSGLRDKLIQAGKNRVTKFSRERAANQVWGILQGSSKYPPASLR